jgi:hypothetical protein
VAVKRTENQKGCRSSATLSTCDGYVIKQSFQRDAKQRRKTGSESNIVYPALGKHNHIVVLIHSSGILQIIIQISGTHFSNAGRADVLTFEVDDFVRLAAKNTSGLILLEDDTVTVNINLQRILFTNAKCPAQLNRDYDATQLIDLTDNTRGLHCTAPPKCYSLPFLLARMSLLLFESLHAGDLGSPYHHMQILQFALTIQHSDNFASTYQLAMPA